MLEKIRHVKNPLTIIAIFSAITEISGTVVLPFVEKGNQQIFVWFLILFPIGLVVLFFLTLNFNPKVLYAPSDYTNEDNFMKMFDRATPDEQTKKIKKDIESIKKMSEVESSQEDISEEKNSKLMGTERILAEKLVFYKLLKELQLSITPGLAFDIGEGDRVLYDGIAIDGNTVHAFDVKYMSRDSGFNEGLRLTGEITQRVSKYICQQKDGKFVYHFIAVTNDIGVKEDKLRTDVEKNLGQFDINWDLRVLKLSDLLKEFNESA